MSSSRGNLDLLSSPSSDIGFAHVGRGLNRGNPLESDVCDTSDADNGAGNLAEDTSSDDERTDEDVDYKLLALSFLVSWDIGIRTNTTSDEGEEEVGVARDLGRNLEFCVELASRKAIRGQKAATYQAGR